MCSLFILLFTFLIHQAHASQETSQNYAILDQTHALFKDNLEYLANKADSFFATERADDEFGRSTLRIRTNYYLRELEKGDSDITYRLNFKIPSLEKKIKEQTDKIFSRNKGEKNGTSSDAPLRSRDDWYFNADVGVNASIPPKAVIRARLRKNIIKENWSHRFLEEVSYITEEDGLSEITSFTSDYNIRENLLFRFINTKIWKVLSRQLTTQHGPNLILTITPRDGINYSLVAQSVIDEEGPWYLENYRFSIRYRRDLYHNWLFFDLTPGLDFPKDYSFRRNPFITFQLEALFGS